tara:strand:+ start:633 stop:923 length:291 start_codon:yes stop_codon:yes gene_type:complete
MEKKGTTTFHGIVNSNVLPFKSKETITEDKKYAEATYKQKKTNQEEFINEEKEMDVLICSLCESNQFYLVNNDIRTVGCANCGYLTSTHWIIPDGF